MDDKDPEPPERVCVTSEFAAVTRRRDKTFFGWCAAAIAMTFLLQFWLCRSLVADYFLTVDELALEAASTEVGGKVDPSHWLTQGFHYYFPAYPEWEPLGTDFWRPAANALFWLHYQIFGTNWGSQLLFGYLLHALVVGLTGVVAFRVFNLNAWFTATAMLISAFNPAHWSTNTTWYSLPELIQYPIYQTEILCALLMMVAFLAFIKNRYALFCLVTTLAIGNLEFRENGIL